MTIVNHDQAQRWNNSTEADHWVTHQARYDRMLEPFGDMVLEVAALRSGERVLDVGCGCGATTLAAARVVAPAEVLGVDLSASMLARADEHAREAGLTNTRFEQADAEVQPFDRSGFDAVISRLGMMFFGDPAAAFANLHRATRPGGRMAFVCFQPMADNPWFGVPIAAMAQHVRLPDPGPSDAPGMFGLADPDRLRGLLDAAGWRDLRVASRHTPVLVGGGGTLDEIVEFLRTGTMGRMLLSHVDADTRGRVLVAVRDALAPYESPEGVRLGAAAWLVTAVA